jgi:hypothetical protein
MGRKMAGRPREFRHHDVVRGIRAARAAGIENPSLRIKAPSGTEYYFSGGAVAPKKHTTAVVAKPPPTRAASKSRRGG